MFICPLCGHFRVAKWCQLMTHIRLLHADDPDFMIQCNLQGCKRTFRKFTVYKNHVYGFHDMTESCDQDTSLLTHSPRFDEEPDCNSSLDSYDMDVGDSHPNISEDLLQSAAAKWILKNREGHRIPHSVMESIVSGAKSLYEIALSGIHHQVIDKMRESHVAPDVIDAVSSVLVNETQYTNVFKGLETTYQQNMYFKTNYRFVEPVQKVLGIRHQPGKLCKDGSLKEIKDTMEYIPILDTIQQLLQNETALSEIERGHCTTRAEVLKDYCDGLVSKSHSIFSMHTNGLQILFYYDDIEVVNNLGSHRKVHKLGVFYFTLGNFHPKYRSRYSSIYLLAICKRKIIARYSMSAVLRPMVDDFKILEQGYDFEVRGVQKTFYGTIAVISADNPASNGLGGFKESTAAYRFCRQCMANSMETRLEFNEDALVLRTRDQHLRDCDAVEADDITSNPTSIQLGINYRSILFELQHFHVDILLPDVMHDLLEGTLQYETKLILQHVIGQKYMSYSVFARALSGLELGYMEADNKPTEIASSTIYSAEKTLGQKAAQMWLLGRVVPYLIGEHIPDSDKHWQNFLQLLEIIDYLMAPEVSEDEVAELAVMIPQHHSLFARLYSASSLIPKHHFMIHMPRLILKYGPLVCHWTMRYEAKHNHLKKLAQNIGNFINIARTLASRHQYWQCYKWQEGDLFADDPEIGPGSLVAVRNRPLELSAVADCYKTSWVRRDGILYKPTCVVTLGIEDDYPLFGTIENIYVTNTNDIHIQVRLLSTIKFNYHHHIYLVEHTTYLKTVILTSLYNVFPLHLRRVNIHGSIHLCIVLKYHILNCLQC